MKRGLVRQIDRYLASHVPLSDLENWVMYNVQVLLDSGDPSAVDLATRVDADLAALDQGLIDEPTLRSRLASYRR